MSFAAERKKDGSMALDNEYEFDNENPEEFTLESILAEYKGSAYIDGDKKTPKELLEKQAERIIMEVTGISSSEASFYLSENGGEEAPKSPREPAAQPAPEEDLLDSPFVETDSFEDAPDEQEYSEKDSEEREPEPLEPERRSGIFSGLFRRREEPRGDSREEYGPEPPAETISETPEDTTDADELSATAVFDIPTQLRDSGEDGPIIAGQRDEPADTRDIDFASETPEQEPLSDQRDQGKDAEEVPPVGEPEAKPLSLMQRIRRLWNDDDEDDEEEEEVAETSGEASPEIAAAEMKPGSEPAADSDSAPTQVAENGFSPEFVVMASDPYESEDRQATRPVRPRRQRKPRPEPEPEPEYAEPDLREECRRLASACNDASIKSLAAIVISAIMAILTFIYAGSGKLPFGIGDNIAVASAVLMVMQLVVSALCLKLLVRGAMDIVKKKPGAESLVLVSGAVTFIAGAQTILSPTKAVGLPYCAVAAFAAAFALWGEKLQLRGMTDSLKTAVSSSEPLGVTAEHSEEINRVLIRKVPGKTDGFYNNLVSADISETVYRIATPVVAAASLILAFLASVGHGRGSGFLHIWAAILSAGVSFSALLAYGASFAAAARRVRKSGAAIAGWAGADDICYSDGVCVRDEDVFPTGTLSLSGMKIYEGVSPEKAIRYTGSIIIASGSGLAKLFSGVLRQQGLSLVRVEDFKCYEGGVGGLIRGERVITGNVAFMNLMGIRVPESMNMSNSVFTAVNDRLVAAFAINYVPANSVQNALVALLRTKLKIFLTSRDFNVSPRLIEQKFKMPMEDIEYIPVSESYNISSYRAGDNIRTAAVICREGLAPFGEVISGSKRLRLASLVATVVSVLASVVGMLLVFFLCWSGAFSSAGAGTVLIYMLLALVLDIVASHLAGYNR